MKLTNIALIIIFLLLLSSAGNSQARSATCRVYALWKDEQVRGSYSGDIGNFKLDGEEGETIRSFIYKEGFVVTVGIDFRFDYSKRPQFPYEIGLAITASDKEGKEIFEMPNSSETRTLYKKKWNLEVTKNVKIKDITYMITISCSDGLKLPRR
jgi:hypothetical protein